VKASAVKNLDGTGRFGQIWLRNAAPPVAIALALTWAATLPYKPAKFRAPAALDMPDSAHFSTDRRRSSETLSAQAATS
jgi:hypothetical protein